MSTIDKIYSKTAKGLAALRNVPKDLSRDSMKILARVDGKSNNAQLIAAFAGMPVQKLREALDSLERNVYIRVLPAAEQEIIEPAVERSTKLDYTPVSNTPPVSEIEVTELSPQDSVQAWAEAQRGAQSLQEKGFYTHTKQAPNAFPRIGLAGLSILIMEDDENISNLMATMLASKEVKVRQVADIPSALAVLKEAEIPDMVLLDVVVPGLEGKDGFHVLEVIRKDPRLAAIPVIMVTSQIGDTDVMHGLKARADGYIFKPLKWATLYRCIRSVFGLPVE
ncbi:response regulator [Undibacterium sp. TJN25]|uniref:response regulator n=1 Tax=Undibacterium sp. TJN25 TaxID=3413056 RepID=UPI003BF34EB9